VLVVATASTHGVAACPTVNEVVQFLKSQVMALCESGPNGCVDPPTFSVSYGTGYTPAIFYVDGKLDSYIYANDLPGTPAKAPPPPEPEGPPDRSRGNSEKRQGKNKSRMLDAMKWTRVRERFRSAGRGPRPVL